MKPCKSFFAYLILVAFLVSGFCTFSGMNGQSSKCCDSASSLNLEDVEDTTDTEDNQSEDGDDSKEAINTRYHLSRHYISMIILQQMQIFRNHHPAIITPPPKA